MRQLSSIITMSALEVHKSHGRRDVVSEAEISCELCHTTVKGRVRDIRKHLRKKHKLESFFKCMDSECNFVCSINFHASQSVMQKRKRKRKRWKQNFSSGSGSGSS